MSGYEGAKCLIELVTHCKTNKTKLNINQQEVKVI